MEKIALEYGWKKIIKMIDFDFPRGIIAGNRMEHFFSNLLNKKKFSDLDIPLTVVATDINTGEEVLINSGLVSKAILASSALPGIFTPKKYNNQQLVDGTLVNPLPVQTALNLGAEMVIAIDVSSPIKSVDCLHGLQRYSHSLLKNICQIPYVNSIVSPIEISKKLKRIIPKGFCTAADGLKIRRNNEEKIKLIPNGKNVILIKPYVKHIHWRDFHRVQKCIDLGSKAITDSVIADIKESTINLKKSIKKYA